MLHVLTYASRPDSNVRKLATTCRRQGLPFTVLGQNEPFQGFGQKLKAQKEFCQDLPDNDLVLFVDAFDVIIYGCKDDILERYHRFETDLVFSAERQCFPDDYRRPDYRALEGNELLFTLPYLNSGCLMGKASVLREILSRYPFDSQTDDQRFYTTVFLEQKIKCTLDHEGWLFPSLHGTPAWWSGAGMFKEHTVPILHYNGAAKVELMKEHARAQKELPSIAGGSVSSGSGDKTGTILFAVFGSLAALGIIVALVVVFVKKK